MLAALGPFVFALRTAPFETFRRSTAQRWASNARLGKRAVKQHLGPGDDSITLSGTLMPEITGGRAMLDALRIMAATGDAWPFIDGEGTIYGLWIIDSIDEERSELFKDGAARKIAFSVKLDRYDDNRADEIGTLSRIGLRMLRGACGANQGVLSLAERLGGNAALPTLPLPSSLPTL